MAGTNKVPFLRRVERFAQNRLPGKLGTRISWIFGRCGWLLDLYRLNLSLANPRSWRARFHRVAQATRHVVEPKWVLFRPDIPEYRHIIYKICLLLGYRMTADPDKAVGAVIKWQDTTFPDREAVLTSMAGDRTVFNLHCRDISKAHTDRIFREVFGYRLNLDPLAHVGPCVRKSNLNARHDGRVISCPIEPEPGFVYQKVIDNEVGDGLVQDVRVPVFKDTIPFVYLKYRSVERRFSNNNTRVELASAGDVFSPRERQSILHFCRRMGVDYGELDVLRHREDGRLYIVDVNTTPWGPPVQLSDEGQHTAIQQLATTFRDVVLGRATVG
jgi:hypothetical protein